MGFTDNKSEDEHKKLTVFRVNNLIVQWKDIISNSEYLYVLLVTVIFESGIQFLLIYWAVYFTEILNFNLTFVFSISMISNIVGGQLFGVLSKKFNKNYLLITSTIILSGAFVGIYLIDISFIKIFCFVVAEFFIGVMSASMLDLENSLAIKYPNKATLLSFISFTIEIFIIISMIFISDLINLFSFESLFFISGIYLLLIIVVNVYFKRKFYFNNVFKG